MDDELIATSLKFIIPRLSEFYGHQCLMEAKSINLSLKLISLRFSLFRRYTEVQENFTAINCSILVEYHELYSHKMNTNEER